jgi:aldehyde dehydrogenase (NAD+)
MYLTITSKANDKMTFRQPYGVCAGIIPWNSPLGLCVMKVAPAVAAGNVIIIKTSEKAPLAPLVLARAIKEVGFPPGVVQFINGTGAPGAALASHMEIRKISFTGSVRTGKIVSEVAPHLVLG